MGDVVEFRPCRKGAGDSRSAARIEKELLLPAQVATMRGNARHPAFAADRWPLHTGRRSESRLPLVGIAIIACAILTYTVVALHVVGQPHYSARANLLPPVWSDD